MQNSGFLAQAAVWIPAALIMVSGIAKLAGVAPVVETLTKLGVGRYRHLLGVMELVFATLFVIPATMHLLVALNVRPASITRGPNQVSVIGRHSPASRGVSRTGSCAISD